MSKTSPPSASPVAATSSRPGGPALPSPALESGWAPPIPGTDGPASWVPCAVFDPDSSSWKTPQALLPLSPDGTGADALPTWPRSGLMCAGSVYAVAKPEPPWKGTGSGSGAGEPGARPSVCGNYNRKGASASSGDGLATQAAEAAWPRPTTEDGGWNGAVCHGGGSDNLTLIGAVRVAENEIGEEGRASRILKEAALPWPRPTAAPKGSETYGHGEGNPTLLGAARAAELSWPRPAASDDAGPRDPDGRRGMLLRDLIREEAWARPRASAAEDRTTKRTPSQDDRHGEYLGVQVQEEEPEGPWPRLTVSDGLGGHCPDTERTRGRQGSEPQKQVLGARLNPAWEESLLGWPIGLVSGLPWPEYGREVAERKREARRNGDGSRPDSPAE